MCSEFLPTKPSLYRLPTTSSLTVGEHQPHAGYKPALSPRPSLRDTGSSSSRHNLQITPQKSGNSTDTLSPESRGASAGPDENENARPRDRPQVTIQSPPVGLGGGLRRGLSGQSTAASELPSPMPVDPQEEFNLSELQKEARNQANGYLGGTGKSSTFLRLIVFRRSMTSRTGVRLPNNLPNPGDRALSGTPGMTSRSSPTSDKTLGGYTNQTRVWLGSSQIFLTSRRKLNRTRFPKEETRDMVSTQKYVFSSPCNPLLT